MTNAKKIVEKAKQKGPRAVRMRLPGIDLTKLQDAVVDGKLVCPLKSKVAFVRISGKRRDVHVGIVFDVNEKEKSLTAWDETRGQFCSVSMSDVDSPIKLIESAVATSPLEVPALLKKGIDGINADEEGDTGSADDERGDSE